jgi:protein-export membrane protein SecD
MKRNLQIKFGVIAVTVLICLYGIIGIPKSKDELVANWRKNIRLGLDLRGGSHLVVQVQEQDAFNAEASTVADRIKDEAGKQSIAVGQAEVAEAKTLADADKVAIVVKGVPSTQAGQFRTLINDEFQQWNLTGLNATDYRLTLKPTEAIAMRQDILKQTRATFEKKINALGLSESSVQQRRGDTDAELLVQLPDVDDPARIKQILQTAAVLELYEVKNGPYATRDQAIAQTGGILQPGSKLIGSDATEQRRGGGWWEVARTPVVKGQDIRDSRPEPDGQRPGQWDTGFVLSQDSARRFEQFTGTHVGSKLAIVLDRQVLSAPTIENQIRDQGRITGATTEEEAADLAINLKAGSLPASVLYMEERTVGPSLGADSMHEGFVAGIAGVLAVVLVMLVYYRKAGINATLALVLNAVILVAALSYFDAVLTLPGIAGVILTIGMAVDSNVLIFERIREELRSGKAIIASVDGGFKKAFLTIIDTHVTTVVSCAILFLFGSGPVKGFAVTLVIGLVANLFTAVFVSKTIFDWELSRGEPVTALSI